ncbi:MAG: methyltransferase domain-containing protein [Bacteroidetes bacterium]|nr:methyltransferase domain-containing protein [Bacteroidota bacterium]MBK9672701.1 methyltransferase domain-containing protein [Bacteroidota bacterium]MBK9800278.1 methyltransferase domain-containing protein [Bacteroidota bacterium]MBP6412438.1 methyltransferase domain-containing protein [Bacteroidia bacterium]
MKKYGKGINSKNFWNKEADEYTSVLKNDYHTHRLSILKKIIPADLYKKGKNILDFGCGDAVIFPDFLKKGANIKGIDISSEIIEIGKQSLKKAGYDPSIISCNDVSYLKKIPSASLDAVMSYNVLAYLSTEEDLEFYKQVSRILKKGGYLIVSHSNELFDMYTFNKYTVEFFNTHFIQESSYKNKIKELMKNSNVPENLVTYNVRENPLCYKFKLAAFKLKEDSQEFSHYHDAPPVLLKKKVYKDTLKVKESDKWKLMFQCSTYFSRSVKV